MALASKCCPSVFFFALAAVFGSCTNTEDGAQPELVIFSEFCAMKEDKGPCKAIKDRFYFNIDTRRCEVFEYGGCGGNDNNFKTLEDCEEKCVVSADKSPCHLEEAPGPCRGMLTRYFFDNISQECKLFYYGGCFGNANNFRSMGDCRAKCKNPDASLFIQLDTQQAVHPHPTDFVPPEYCLSALDVGTCDRNETRFAYNLKTKKCHMFNYSGCGGNKNNFSMKRHCMRKCMNVRRRNADKKDMIRIRKKNISNILFYNV